MAYIPNINQGTNLLSEVESRHFVKVLRKKEGDIIHAVDGNGSLYELAITTAHHKKCEYRIVSSTANYNPPNNYLHIAISPTKNIDRFEWFLEKATEIGVNEVTPILAKHSERKEVKAERLNKILIAAMKQSEQAYLPRLNPMTKIEHLVDNDKSEQKFIAHCHDTQRLSFMKTYKKQASSTILIGPEGDFSPEEVDLSLKNGFKPITLGKNRLRTETAGVAACHAVNFMNS